MRITWKDGVTTLAAAGTVVVERIHNSGWDVLLLNEVRWAIFAIVLLAAISFVFSFLLDTQHDLGWTIAASVMALVVVVLTVMGAVVATSEYVTWLTLSTVGFWLVAITSHLAPTSKAHHGHA